MGTVLAITALVLALFAFGGAQDVLALQRRGVPARGEVIAVHDLGRRGDYVTVAFRLTDGREVEGQVERFAWRTRPKPLDVLTVRYDPADPVANVVDERVGPDTATPWLVGVAAVLAFGLAGFTAAGRIDWELSAARRRREG
ncbi:MAG: DUF3592 domain-containing protein [Kineosporiaceae bacterium]